MKLLVEFDRIGRNHNPDALEIDDVAEPVDWDKIADVIYHHVRAKGRLASRDVEVIVGNDNDGTIFCGMQVGGTFKISRAG